MQQRDIIKDQIKQADRVMGRLVARFYDLKSDGNLNEAIHMTQSDIQSKLNIDLNALLLANDADTILNYTKDNHISVDQLDKIIQMFFDIGKELTETQPEQGYLTTCFNLLDAISDLTDVISTDRILLRSQIEKLRTKKLIVISDMYGFQDDKIPDHSNFEIEGWMIQHYDCRQISSIDKNDNIHAQYLESGIEKGVEYLLENESDIDCIVAYSMGGTIAWKAIIKGLNVKHLIAVSATRLRLETEKPNCKLSLLYGADDGYQPTPEWFDHMKIIPEIYEHKNHEMYKEIEIKNRIETLLSDGF